MLFKVREVEKKHKRPSWHYAIRQQDLRQPGCLQSNEEERKVIEAEGIASITHR